MRYEHIKAYLEKTPYRDDNGTLHQIATQLLKALELCHENWKQECIAGCYLNGFSDLVPKMKERTPDYWLEEVMKEIENG